MKINMKESTGTCRCGKEHKLTVEDIYLEAGALEKIPDILSRSRYSCYQGFVMICDENTYEAVGKTAEQKIDGLRRIRLSSRQLHACGECGRLCIDGGDHVLVWIQEKYDSRISDTCDSGQPCNRKCARKTDGVRSRGSAWEIYGVGGLENNKHIERGIYMR